MNSIRMVYLLQLFYHYGSLPKIDISSEYETDAIELYMLGLLTLTNDGRYRLTPEGLIFLTQCEEILDAVTVLT